MRSSPEGKSAACRKLTVSPRAPMLSWMWPLLISSSISLDRIFNDGSSSARCAASPSAVLGGAAAACRAGSCIGTRVLAACPGPRIAASTVESGCPASAFFTESDTFCALALSVCAVANITTKKANSSVMKSAYDTSQRSWFSFSGGGRRGIFSGAGCGCTGRRCGTLLGGAGRIRVLSFRLRFGARVRLQLAADELGIQALHDSSDTLQHQLLALCILPDARLDLIGRGKQKEIRETDAIDRGHKCHGDAMPHLLNIGEILHYLNQSQHGADDANRRRVTSRTLERLGLVERMLFLDVDLKVHHLTDLLEIGPVDGQVQGLTQEGISDLLGVVFERHNSVFPRLGSVADDFINQRVGCLATVEQHMAESLDRARENGQRGIDQNCTQCSAQHNKCSRDLSDVLDSSAFEKQAAQNPGAGNHESTDGCEIGLRLLPRCGGHLLENCLLDRRSGSGVRTGIETRIEDRPAELHHAIDNLG